MVFKKPTNIFSTYTRGAHAFGQFRYIIAYFRNDCDIKIFNKKLDNNLLKEYRFPVRGIAFLEKLYWYTQNDLRVGFERGGSSNFLARKSSRVHRHGAMS